MRKILVIDGQGGRLGKEIIEQLQKLEEVEIIAVGTNSMATQAMLKTGVSMAATGENPVVSNAKTADIIVGPIGIVIANSLLGEVTPNMAVAVGESSAKKVLIPVNKCDNFVIATKTLGLTELINEAIEKIKEDLASLD